MYCDQRFENNRPICVLRSFDQQIRQLRHRNVWLVRTVHQICKKQRNTDLINIKIFKTQLGRLPNKQFPTRKIYTEGSHSGAKYSRRWHARRENANSGGSAGIALQGSRCHLFYVTRCCLGGRASLMKFTTRLY